MQQIAGGVTICGATTIGCAVAVESMRKDIDSNTSAVKDLSARFDKFTEAHAEMHRKDAEQRRKDAEAHAEMHRKDAEAHAEMHRKDAKAHRKDAKAHAEMHRKDAEQRRKDAEAHAEMHRKDAEAHAEQHRRDVAAYTAQMAAHETQRRDDAIRLEAHRREDAAALVVAHNEEMREWRHAIKDLKAEELARARAEPARTSCMPENSTAAAGRK